MAAPDFVPSDPRERVRSYSSPPGRIDAWRADRPGDLDGGQPKGDGFGNPGPDQGYAYRLVRHLEDSLHFGEVARDDAVAGCVAVAMKRAAHFGRAPVVHDLRAAFTVFGFFDPSPPPELVEMRRALFAQVRSPHHYGELRDLVDTVPVEVLGQSNAEITKAYSNDWRSNLSH